MINCDLLISADLRRSHDEEVKSMRDSFKVAEVSLQVRWGWGCGGSGGHLQETHQWLSC